MAGELITRDGQIEYNGLLFGAGTPYRWVALDGWEEMPGLDSGDVPRPGQHGEEPGDLWAQGRVVTFTHRISAPDLRKAVRDRDSALAVTQDETPLVVRDHGETLMVWARPIVRGVPKDLAYAVGIVSSTVVQWKATDPRRYSLEVLTAATGLPTRGEGFAYPLTYPLNYGAPGTAGQVRCTNDGNTDTPCLLTINGGDAVRPVILNARTGAQLVFDLTLTAADELTVDTRTGQVLVNGANRSYAVPADSADPVAFTLAPGDTDVAFRATSGNAILTVTWQHAHM